MGHRPENARTPVAAFPSPACSSHLPKVRHFPAFSTHLPKVRRWGTALRTPVAAFPSPTCSSHLPKVRHFPAFSAHLPKVNHRLMMVRRCQSLPFRPVLSDHQRIQLHIAHGCSPMLLLSLNLAIVPNIFLKSSQKYKTFLFPPSKGVPQTHIFTTPSEGVYSANPQPLWKRTGATC